MLSLNIAIFFCVTLKCTQYAMGMYRQSNVESKLHQSDFLCKFKIFLRLKSLLTRLSEMLKQSEFTGTK